MLSHFRAKMYQLLPRHCLHILSRLLRDLRTFLPSSSSQRLSYCGTWQQSAWTFSETPQQDDVAIIFASSTERSSALDIDVHFRAVVAVVCHCGSRGLCGWWRRRLCVTSSRRSGADERTVLMLYVQNKACLASAVCDCAAIDMSKKTSKIFAAGTCAAGSGPWPGRPD